MKRSGKSKWMILWWLGGAGIALMLGAPLVVAQMRSPQDQQADRNEKEFGFHGVIEGRILYKNGTPASGYRVIARFESYVKGPPGQGFAVSDAQGYYRIRGLAPKRFHVFVDNGGKPYIPSAERLVDVTAKSVVSHVDFALEPGPEVTIRVCDAETGKPVRGLEVSFGNGKPVGRTDSKGEFETSVGSLAFEIWLSDPNKRDGYTPAPGYPFFKTFRLPAPTKLTWNVLAYNGGSQSRPAVFRGVVVDISGTPVPGATVQFMRFESKTAVTDSKGQFQFKTNRIQPYETERGAGAVIVATKGNLSATKIPTAEETWGVIRVVVEKNAASAVRGRIVDEYGKPVPDCPITYWPSYRISSNSGQPQNGGSSDSNGRFVVSGLSPYANYHFLFGRTSELTSYGTTLVPKDAYHGNFIQVKRGETKDLGAIVVPTATKRLEGTIVDEKGRPVSKNVIVVIEGDHSQVTPTIDAKGHFSWKSTVDEPLTLRIFVGDGHFYRTGQKSPDLLLTKKIKAGDTNLRLKVKMRPPIK